MKSKKYIITYRSLYDLFRERKKNRPIDLSTIKKQYPKGKCYLCGIPLNNINRSKDHIPSQCLFAGLGERYKRNRITVPCCKKCNVELSKYENEFRNLIGITNNKNKRVKQLTKDAVKELYQKKNLPRLLFSDISNVYGVEFSEEPILQTVIKTFKGVFFKITGDRIPDKFQIYPVIQAKEDFIFYLDDCLQHSKWYYSGSYKIFKFRMEYFNLLIKKTTSINNVAYIICKLVFHESYIFYLIAKNNERLDV